MQVYNNKTMWRELLKRTHPDASGNHELFIFTMKLRDAVCGSELVPATSRREPRDRSRHDQQQARVPFDPFANFEALTDRAVALSEAVQQPYRPLLQTLANCYPATGGALYDQQKRGATYRQLAAIGHMVGMSGAERAQWYKIAETVPLSQRHAGHVIQRLKRAAA